MRPFWAGLRIYLLIYFVATFPIFVLRVRGDIGPWSTEICFLVIAALASYLAGGPRRG